MFNDVVLFVCKCKTELLATTEPRTLFLYLVHSEKIFLN